MILKLPKKLTRPVGKTIADFKMIQNGDRAGCCLQYRAGKIRCPYFICLGIFKNMRRLILIRALERQSELDPKSIKK